MHPRALADCAEFLGVDHDDVLTLRDDADLLPALIARIGLALAERVERDDSPGATPLPDHGAAWLAAVRRGWGTLPFTCADLIAWSEQTATLAQREVLAASRALCRLHDGADLTSAKLSAALRLLLPRRIEAVGDRRGSMLWTLRDSRD